MINFKTLYLALRPWSLPASISPVIVGTAMAFGDGQRNVTATILTLLVAICIHLGTNVVNDIGDFRSGVDAANPGATFNVILEGLVPERDMISLSIGFFLSAAIFGLVAVVLAKAWILIGIGGIAILAGIFYTAGSKPAAYSGLGEILVIIFFGPVTTGGTYYLQTHSLTLPVILAGLSCGLICSGILIINHYRDYDGDRAVGKNTLAVRFGRKFAQWEYTAVLILAAMIPFFIFLLTNKAGVLLSLFALLGAIPLVKTIFSTEDVNQLSCALASTGKLLLIFSILFSIGWVI